MYKKIGISFLLLQPALTLAEEQQIQDRIEVTGKLPQYQQSLSKVLPQSNLLDETSNSTDSLASLLVQAPEINFNGQGGLLQAVNIRGFARWRIQTLIEGIPIYTERRAGTAAEFIPPGFIGQAYLTAGAASTQLGSGAIGGGLDLHLATPEQNQIKLTYGHDQNYRDILLQGQTAPDAPENGLSWQVNHRHANNSSSGQNTPIFDGFEQHSISLRKRSGDSFLQETLLLYSSANNVAKASSDEPGDRFTVYPENKHFLGKMAFDWHNAAIYVHDAQLDTITTRPGKRTNISRNNSRDLGLRFTDNFNKADWEIHWRAGLDGRTSVKAYEKELSANGVAIFDRLNLDGEQWEAAVALDASKQLHNSSLAGGIRLAHHYQKDQLTKQSKNNNQTSAFVGYAFLPTDLWQLSAYISSAYRVPSLTERFFNGSTPRGTVLGDPELKTENAINIQTSIQYEQADSLFELNIFHQRINDYIERLKINDELRRYRNLDSAEIQGISYRWQKQASWQNMDWKLSLNGQRLWGEDQSGESIPDISPAEHRLTLSLFTDNADAFISIKHRQNSDDEASGELPTPGTTIIDAGYSYHLNVRTKLTLNLSNIADKLYVTSRDDLAPFARGRDVQLSVSFVL